MANKIIQAEADGMRTMSYQEMQQHLLITRLHSAYGGRVSRGGKTTLLQSTVNCGHRPTTTALASIFMILSLQTQIRSAVGFSSSKPAIISFEPRHSMQHLLSLKSEAQSSNSIGTFRNADDDAAANGPPPKLTGSLSGSRLHEFELKQHKPLGLSVEESLANEPDGAKYVFVADVNKGGNAAGGGIRVGDVIVQLSGTFDEVVDVAGLGIEKIRSLVGGRPEGSSLIIRVARGSDVMERHELALVELCIIGDDADTAECITSLYSAEDNIYENENSAMTVCDEDDGTECMLDSMWNVWTEGMPLAASESEDDAIEQNNEKKKVAPWSSRSSPSGTYVRDPKTGKMVNIDE